VLYCICIDRIFAGSSTQYCIADMFTLLAGLCTLYSIAGLRKLYCRVQNSMRIYAHSIRRVMRTVAPGHAYGIADFMHIVLRIYLCILYCGDMHIVLWGLCTLHCGDMHKVLRDYARCLAEICTLNCEDF
jgi:hypothetical protein